MRPGKEHTHQFRLSRGQRCSSGEGVDEEAVALIRWHSARAGVGLVEVALLFQVGHLVTHGRGRDGQLAQLRDVCRANRLSCPDVALHDSAKNGGFAVVQHLWHLRLPSASPRLAPLSGGRWATNCYAGVT